MSEEAAWSCFRSMPQHGDQRAFAQVVSEHVDMVYSGASAVGDRHLAESDQAVFCDSRTQGRPLVIMCGRLLHKPPYSAQLRSRSNVRRITSASREMAMDCEKMG